MECNKDEAIRAKELAEKKMSSNDYVGARKMILKAQKLYPSTENITQMLIVCEVHCSAECQVHGLDPDWYSILQVEQTADEAFIKKQFRKLALQLHPDKNKFPGAEAAFKLISEAQKLLCDKTTRQTFDWRRMAMRAGPSGQQKQSQPQPIRNNYTSKQPGIYSNPASTGTTARFTSMNPQQQKQHQTQPMFANGQQTFWTACPFCSSRCRSYRDKMNKAIRCQSCKRPFIAYESNNQGSSHNGQKMAPENKQGNRGSAVPVSQPPTKTGKASVGWAPKPKAKEDVNVRPEAGAEGKGVSAEPKLSGTKSRKRGRNSGLEEDSVRCNTGSSSNMEEVGDHEAQQKYGINNGRATRSTSRQKHDNVSNDNDIASGSRRKNNTINEPEEKVEKYERRVPLEESTPGGNAENCKKKGEEVSADDGPGTVVAEVPDPDLYDFDRDRSEECFAVDQMWAIFDDLDGMPRFYARVKKVYSPFKVDVTWLDFVAKGLDETAWRRNRLPVACGKFKHEKTETIEDICIFSHRIVWDKGVRNSYMIYPRKGETWALYKNWNIKWSSDPNNHRELEYEFIVVLSDYTHESGILVARLVKLKGFVCLFMPTKNDGMASFQIPSNEILRFSHRVPSFRTNGKERKDVPEGYFELDPASMPSNLEEVSDFIDVKADGKVDGSSKVVLEEKPHVPKKRKNPDEKRTLNGSTPGRTRSSSRMSNHYDKNANAENIEKSIPKTFSASDGKVDGSSKVVLEEKPHMLKKRKNPDEKSTLNGSTPGRTRSSSRMSNDYDKNANEENIEKSIPKTFSASDGKVDGSSKVVLEEKPHMPKKRKNPVEKSTLNGSTPGRTRSSSRMSNDYDKNANEENIEKSIPKTFSASVGVTAKTEGVSEQISSLITDPGVIPQSESYFFEVDKTRNKFEAGQVWALYCELDGLPKYYAQIKKVESTPKFKVHIKWLKACTPPKGVLRWHDKKMPVCCGVFSSGDKTEFSNTARFSHHLKGAAAVKGYKYEIYPRKGEVWAIYRNFSSEWSSSDLQTCHYDICEVKTVDGAVKVSILEKVSDYEKVFKGQRISGREIIVEIPRHELLRFSHPIPAIQLTDEKQGTLRGCWELDPKAMPVCFFNSK